jgi:hypothetical protein
VREKYFLKGVVKVAEPKIFTGVIGCGKSFLASRFARQFSDVVVNMDSIQAMRGRWHG